MDALIQLTSSGATIEHETQRELIRETEEQIKTETLGTECSEISTTIGLKTPFNDVPRKSISSIDAQSRV